MSYTPRIVDAEIREKLASMGAVVLEGPKACGKTEAARQHAASEVLFDVDDAALQAAQIEPRLVMDRQARPLLLDEWQLVPGIWDRVRRDIDAQQEPGQFILTGSNLAGDDQRRHTGAGRIARVQMRTMSSFEMGQSTGDLSLSSFLDDDSTAAARSDADIHAIAAAIARGGWPGFTRLGPRQVRTAVADYLHSTVRVDVPTVGGTGRNPEKVMRVVQSLARNVATEVTVATITKDVSSPGAPIKDETVNLYLETLGRLMVLEDQPAWTPNLRSRYRLRTTPKRHFIDPSLAVAALGATPANLVKDPGLLGLLFESMVVRDLRIYAQAQGGQVMHFRSSEGHEMDAVITLPDGRWIGVEVKLAPDRTDEGAQTLTTAVAQIDTTTCGEPSALMVITGWGYAHQRQSDGVYVAPIWTLGP